MRFIEPKNAIIELSIEDLNLIIETITLLKDLNKITDSLVDADVRYEYSVEDCTYTDSEITDYLCDLKEEIHHLI